MSPLRLSRSSRTTLLTSVLLVLIGFPLVLLAFMSTTPDGPRTIANLASWGDTPSEERDFVTPISLVLRGDLKGKGLDWQGKQIEATSPVGA
jgi:hypothetical protein